MAATEQQTFWQQDDKSVMGKIFLTIGAFAGVMVITAIVIGAIL